MNVKYSTKSLAKEVGFKVLTEKKLISIDRNYCDARGNFTDETYESTIERVVDCNITQEHLQTWLRDTQLIQTQTYPIKVDKWECILFFLNQPLDSGKGFRNKMSLHFDNPPYDWKTHEEALEVAIFEALRVVKKRKILKTRI